MKKRFSQLCIADLRLGHLPNPLGFPGYPCSIPETRVFASVSVQTDTLGPEILFGGTPPPVPITNHKVKSFPRLYPSPISTVDDHSQQDTLLPASASSCVRETDDVRVIYLGVSSNLLSKNRRMHRLNEVSRQWN